MGTLNNLVGQESLRQKLGVLIEDTRRRGAPLPHLLLCGPPGLGKASFVAAIADGLQRPLRGLDVLSPSLSSNKPRNMVDARSIEKPGDFAALLTNLTELDILGIENIDAIPNPILEVFGVALGNFQLPIVIGEGSSARHITIDLPRFTLIATTSKASRVDDRLGRWMTQYHFAPYTDREMQQIVKLLAANQKLTLTLEAAELFVRHSDGSPANAAMLLRKLVNYEYHLQGSVTLNTATAALQLLGYEEGPANSRDVLRRLHKMSGVEFERFVCSVFQRQGYSAELTSASGDHGIDIVLRKPGQVVAVQCKQWDNAVGEPILRDFYGAINAGFERGFVVTSSNFTAHAEAFAQNKPISLINVDSLIYLYLGTLSSSSCEIKA